LIATLLPGLVFFNPRSGRALPLAQKPLDAVTAQKMLETEHAPGQLLVRFDRWVDPASLLYDADATLLRAYRVEGLQLITVSTALSEKMQALSRTPGVRYVEPNYVVRTQQVPTDPGFPRLWALDNEGQTGGRVDADIDAPEAWETDRNAAEIIVAGIDTGIDYTHPDLAANIWTNPGEIPDGIDNDGNGFIDDIHGYDFANDDSDPFDDNGHGTHTAGTIGMVEGNAFGGVGVAHRVQLMALKFLNRRGEGFTSDAIMAIEYATTMGASVSNNSWGGSGFSLALRDAIETFGAQGGLFVAAAGNGSNDNDEFPQYPASFTPRSDNVVSVAATDANDALAWFSNFGAHSVDVGAPGVDIYSTIPFGRHLVFSGTSMAAPHVAGASALYLSRFPLATPTQIKAALISSSDKVSALQNGLTNSGGRLNLATLLVTEPEEPEVCRPGDDCRYRADLSNFSEGCIALPPDEESPPGARNQTECEADIRVDEDGSLERSHLASVSVPFDLNVLEPLRLLLDPARPDPPSPCILDEDEDEDQDEDEERTETGRSDYTCEGLAPYTQGLIERAEIEVGESGLDGGFVANLTTKARGAVDFELTSTSSRLERGAIGAPDAESRHPIAGSAAGDRITLDIDTPGSFLDATLELVDAQGNRVAFNDDFDGLDSFIEVKAPADGDYTAIVRGFPGGFGVPGLSTGSYQLTITVETRLTANTVTAVECIVSPGALPRAPVRSSVAGTIATRGAQGRHAIAGVLAGDQITLDIDTPDSGLDSTLELVDPQGNRVAFNDDFDGLDSFIEVKAPADGDYTAIVRGFPGGFGIPGFSTGSYLLTIMVKTLLRPRLDANGEPTDLCEYRWERERDEPFIEPEALEGARICTITLDPVPTGRFGANPNGSCTVPDAFGNPNSCGSFVNADLCGCTSDCVEFGICCPDVADVCGEHGFDTARLADRICHALVNR